MFIRVLEDNSLVYPYYLSSLLVDFPYTSWTANISSDLVSLEGHGIFQVYTAAQPEINPYIQKVVEATPSHNGEIWVQTWEVVDLTEQEIADKQAEYLAFISQRIVNKTQKRLDEFAKTRNYDGILSACTYAVSDVPKFKAEGLYCVQM